MKSIFNRTDIGGITAENRIVRSATFENPGPDLNGAAGEMLGQVYGQLARGGVGIIISGMFGVDPAGLPGPTTVQCFAEGFESGLSKLARTVHENGSKLVIQLNHAGIKSAQVDGAPAPGASADVEFGPGKSGRAMTKEEIKAVTQRFAEAAALCKAAGADGVQLHASHGYLLSQFLSPFFNKREDEYGGPIENRARFLMEVYDAVRAAVGGFYPVWVKINSTDRVEPSITLEECLTVCKMLDDKGINALEVTGGAGNGATSTPALLIKTAEDEGSFRSQALQVAKNVSSTVISVGGYRSPDVIDVSLAEGDIEAVSLCRALITEPDIVNRWKDGNTTKSRCISCNRCFSPKGGFGCKAFPAEA